jgi:hypothetical protein
MNKYKITISATAESEDAAKKLAGLLQEVAGKVSYEDMVKLLAAVVKRPAVVKTAIKFV